jgi:hypothetical protein
MIFLRVMEVLNALVRRADGWALLHGLGHRLISHRAVFYVDGMVLFIKAEASDILVTWEIFKLFEGASGLGCNMSKTQLAPIRCTADEVETAISLLSCQLVQFPIKYLSIPLSMSKLSKASLQPMVDKMADNLSAWKGNIMHRSVCLALIKLTLYATSVYTAISIKLPGWLLHAVEKIAKTFLWTRSEEVRPVKCLMAWGRVQRPLRLGGLEILDLCRFGQALQVHWLWLRCVKSSRP